MSGLLKNAVGNSGVDQNSGGVKSDKMISNGTLLLEIMSYKFKPGN